MISIRIILIHSLLAKVDVKWNSFYLNAEKKHLCLNGYRYREKNQPKNGFNKWQCTFGSCRAVGYLDEQQEFTLKTEHAHLPSLSKIQAKKFANEVREKVANTVNAPRQIVFNAKIDLPLYAAPTIPSYPSSLRSINRVRQQALETMPKLKNFESVDEIPEPLKLSHSSDTFLYFDSGKSDSRILVFATLPALDLLSQSEICHCDRTFSVAPDVFYQVYTIHGVIENAVIPLVYALLPNKTQNTYENIFGCLEQFEKK